MKPASSCKLWNKICFTVFVCCLVAQLLVQGTLQAEDVSAEEVIPIPDELIEDLLTPKPDRFISYANGETLKFTLGWGVFTAAKAKIEVQSESFGDKPAIQISMHTETKGFVDVIYPVNNYSWSWISPEVDRSFGYKVDQKEGKRKRHTQATFDWNENTVVYENFKNGEIRDPVAVKDYTFDPLGIVFYVRTLDFEVGDRLVIPTTNGKEFFYTIVYVRKKVTRDFKSGRFEAYVIEPDIKDVGGVFKRSEDGEIRFFFSADEYKIPLRMESEVAVGKFWAELTEWNGKDLTK